MTNYEAISSSLYPYNVDDFLIEKACIDEDIASGDLYSKDCKKIVAKVTISILRKLVVLSSESNGGYSLSYDTDDLKERIFDIAMENGMDDVAKEFDTRSRITDISDQW